MKDLISELNIRPEPDFNRLLKVLERDGEPDRVPFFELFSHIEPEVMRALGRGTEGGDGEEGALRRHIDYQYTLGYDYVNLRARNVNFPQPERPRAMTAHGERSYVLASSHAIANRQEFEAYPWPDISKADYASFELAQGLIPDGMKAIVVGPGGVLENVMWLLGYEGVSYLLADDEPLVRDMFDAVGSRLVEYFGAVASFDIVGAVTLGDDLGHKTQTLLSPAVYREYLFPWHDRIVEAVHAHGKPVILHACGNLREIMDDLIASGWDAKHSFEDVIEPVWDLKAAYGDRISFLGGFDMDKLCRMTPDQVRAHTRRMIDQTAGDGGWALGTGNSVANYIPVENFLAMLNEGFAYGQYG